MIEKSFKGTDGVELFYDVYEANDTKAILQIVHGSIEHGRRYKHFAESLATNGITVYIGDLRGHGRSINKKLNYLSDEDNGWDLYVEETRQLTEIIKNDYPNLKLFIFGHSMGSFVVRDFISKYSDIVDGVLLSGTGSTPPIMMKIAQRMIKSEMKKHGKEAYSEKLHKLIYGGLDKKVKKYNVTSFVSRDENIIKMYNDDPLCGEVITIDYANEMAKGVLYIESKDCYQSTGTVPMYIFSGQNDPVGGKNCNLVRKIARKYEKVGLDDVTVKIYPEALHEMINELNKEDVYKDVINWINAKI